MHLVVKDDSLFGISICFGIFGIFGISICFGIFSFETQSPVLLRDVDSDHGDGILAEKRPSSDVRELEGVVHLERDNDDDDIIMMMMMMTIAFCNHTSSEELMMKIN